MAFRVRHPPHSAWKRITKARTSDAGEDALRRLRSFLDAKEPEIVRLLARLWGDQQRAITYQELRTAILNGYIDEQTAQDWMNDYSHFVNEKLRPQWEDAMRAANARLEAEHPGLFFNAHDPGVQEWLSTRGGELITVIGWEQRQAINAMVGRAYAGEWTVDELARAIRPTIGLNRPQATDKEVCEDLICLVMRSVSRLCVIPMQDYLGLGKEARINRPSTLGINWKWRLTEGTFDEALEQRMHDLALLYGRNNWEAEKLLHAEEKAESEKDAEH